MATASLQVESHPFPASILRRPFAVAADSTGERRRRALNVLIAVVALVVAAQLFVLIAVAVWISSGHPIFYTQTRVGLDRRAPRQHSSNHRRVIDYGGRLFRIYKFRTMRNESDADQQVWASPTDSRVTRVGRILRKYRLDELPQLLNVLKGDMNFVGPRPEQPDIFRDLRTQIDYYANRQRVLPGITGWAQINQHYDRSIEDVRRKVRYDLEYIHRCSPVEDLKIVLKTVPVVLFQRGAW
jgi:lipopolysaccharide/colanic/teichoic acid biosynthesis glycosyltransferase